MTETTNDGEERVIVQVSEGVSPLTGNISSCVSIRPAGLDEEKLSKFEKYGGSMADLSALMPSGNVALLARPVLCDNHDCAFLLTGAVPPGTPQDLSAARLCTCPAPTLTKTWKGSEKDWTLRCTSFLAITR